MPNLLSIAQSGLMAAQSGLATSGHNIANQGTPGYSRQIVVQTTQPGQNFGGGFIGSGTRVETVLRQYDDFLGQQLASINTAKGVTEAYYNQISNINNMLGDASSGLSPVIQSFFAGVQALAGGANQVPQRTGMLSAAESLASRFQSMAGQLQSINDQVNTQITASVDAINAYAQQIAALNDAISKASGANEGQPPNDLLDQRDYLVSQLSQQTQVQVVKEGFNYSVFIGNGQPMVIGTTAWKLATMQSSTDPTQLQVGYIAGGGKVVPLSENSLPGGTLGGLMQFRAQALTTAQNSLGRIAMSLAATFNAQHQQGVDLNGNMGGAFFATTTPTVSNNSFNTGTGSLSATISDVGALSTSNYQFGFDGTNYYVRRLSDNKDVFTSTNPPGGVDNPGPPPTYFAPAVVDGVQFSVSGTMSAGDNFLVKPTANGATGFKVLIKDPSLIAAAVPILTSAPTSNAGSGSISAGSVDNQFTMAMVAPSINLMYDAATNTFSRGIPIAAGMTLGFDVKVTSPTGVVTNVPAGTALPAYPAGSTISNATTGKPVVMVPGAAGFPFEVKVAHADGTAATIYPANTPIPYAMGDTWTFGTSLPGPPADVAGITIQLNGVPKQDDSFTISGNPQTDSDNRNMNLLAALQTANTMVNGTTTYQGAFGQMVSAIGNKTNELSVTQKAQENLKVQIEQQQQALSGVNLDEEATNLIRYQQAYQASAKVMQAVKEMFDIIANIH